jgi:N-acetylglutamate synthase-like GNAT family acetyltransferase
MTGVRVSSDPAELDIDWIHEALSNHAFWALGRSRADVEASITASVCVGAYRGTEQVGFARVVTDGVTFAWLCDVFVAESERGSGIGTRLVEAILADPRVAGVKRIALATTDAASLYARLGFQPIGHPERWMERRTADRN